MKLRDRFPAPPPGKVYRCWGCDRDLLDAEIEQDARGEYARCDCGRVLVQWTTDEANPLFVRVG